MSSEQLRQAAQIVGQAYLIAHNFVLQNYFKQPAIDFQKSLCSGVCAQ